MSQNNQLLVRQGLPVLSKEEKLALRKKWQDITFKDMYLSLKQYNKYVMLRPTGFGKTYTCAVLADEFTEKGTVVFVYKSEILKRTFEAYSRGKNPVIKHPDRIVYATYSSVGLYWGDKDYLLEELGIKNVSLIIFDECQFMGAETYRKALDFALTYIGHTVYTDDDTLINNPEQLGRTIPYIGATATIERRDVDVCDKYFTYNSHGGLTYCWGENVFTLEDAFNTGLIIPPYYQYISATDSDGNSIISKNRLTRNALLKNLHLRDKDGDAVILQSIKELQSVKILDADKIIHDTMLYLYKCSNPIKDMETLPEAEFESRERPTKLPKYMRFLVFTHDRDSMSQVRVDGKDEFLGIIGETQEQFYNAFGRYGYTIRTTVVSSACAEETNNVNLIDPTPEELKKINADLVDENELSKAVTHKNNGKLVIDLIFSINMLNVGYHVDYITGLVLRRWTGSNTIYYQQLGRCLSVDSDKIPVVFDFVDSIASAEITAPLFAVDKTKKAVTTYANGTEGIAYKGKKKRKPRINETKVVDGKVVNPKWSIGVRSMSVMIDSAVADCSEVLSRLNVYQTQFKAFKVFDRAYEKYLGSYMSKDGIVIEPNKMISLHEGFRSAVYEMFPERLQDGGLLTINANALYNYIKKKGYQVFIEYGIYKSYADSKAKEQAVSSLADEYNSLFMIAKQDSDAPVAKLNFVVNTKDYDTFKKDKEIKGIMKQYGMTDKNVVQYVR